MSRIFITALSALTLAGCTATSFRTSYSAGSKAVTAGSDSAEGIILSDEGDNAVATGTITSGSDEGAAGQINQINSLPMVPLCGCQNTRRMTTSSLDFTSLLSNGVGNVGTNSGANNTGNGNGNYNVGDNNGNNNTGSGNGNYNCGNNNGNNNGGNTNGNYNVTDGNGNDFNTDGNGNGAEASSAACCRCMQNDGSTAFTTAANCAAAPPSAAVCAAQ